MAADLVSTGEDIVVEGDSLRPGVYYIALAQNAADLTAAGALTATVTSVDRSDQQLKLSPLAGDRLSPKSNFEVRQELTSGKTGFRKKRHACEALHDAEEAPPAGTPTGPGGAADLVG